MNLQVVDPLSILYDVIGDHSHLQCSFCPLSVKNTMIKCTSTHRDFLPDIFDILSIKLTQENSGSLKQTCDKKTQFA